MCILKSIFTLELTSQNFTLEKQGRLLHWSSFTLGLTSSSFKLGSPRKVEFYIRFPKVEFILGFIGSSFILGLLNPHYFPGIYFHCQVQCLAAEMFPWQRKIISTKIAEKLICFINISKFNFINKYSQKIQLRGNLAKNLCAIAENLFIASRPVN